MHSKPLANPGPLGLMGFGMTTILLNLHNAGFFPLTAVIVSMGIFYGGLIQILAGMMEFKKGNTFGTTAFTSYGAFWLSLVGILMLPRMGMAEASSESFLGAYLGLWGRALSAELRPRLAPPRCTRVYLYPQNSNTGVRLLSIVLSGFSHPREQAQPTGLTRHCNMLDQQYTQIYIFN